MRDGCIRLTQSLVAIVIFSNKESDDHTEQVTETVSEKLGMCKTLQETIKGCKSRTGWKLLKKCGTR